MLRMPVFLFASFIFCPVTQLTSESDRQGPEQFSTDQLETIMFADTSDAQVYRTQCGQNWPHIFRFWEQQQFRALDGDTSIKAIVWRCRGGCGGLGDRQRGILTSFMLAMVTGRAFFVDSIFPTPLRHYFRVANPVLHWTFSDDLIFGRSCLEEEFTNGDPSIGDYAIANLSRYDEYDVVIQTNNYWQPFHVLRNPSLPKSMMPLRSYADHVLAGCILNYLLVPSSELQQQVSRVRRLLAANTQQLLAVQVRTGDHQAKNLTVIEALTRHFKSCVAAIQDSSSQKYRVFLTTDSEEVEHLLRAAYPDLVNFPGELYHVDGSFGAPQSFDAAFSKVVLDHLMVSQAHLLLISRSGFAEYAALRGFKPYYMPFHCEVNSPIEHYFFPTAQPIGAVGGEINSLDIYLSQIEALPT